MALIGPLRPRSFGIKAKKEERRALRVLEGVCPGGRSRLAPFRLELRFIGRVRYFAPSAFAHTAAVLFEAAAVS